MYSPKKKRPLWRTRLTHHSVWLITCIIFTSEFVIFHAPIIPLLTLQEIDMSEKIDNLIKKMENARSRLNAAMQKIAPQDEIYPCLEAQAAHGSHHRMG